MARPDNLEDMIQGIRTECNVDFDIEPKKTRKRPIRAIIRIFRAVNDPRDQKKITYRLEDLLAMIFIAKLAFCDTFKEMEDFWNDRTIIKLYHEIFKDYEEVPSHDTFDRVMGLVKAKEFQDVLFDAIAQVEANIRKAFGAKKRGRSVASGDGKVLKGTGELKGTSREKRDVQTMNIISSSSFTMLGSDEIAEKTNEIGHGQKMLEAMDLRGTIFTSDSMNAQKKTVGIVADGKGDYVIGLKGNQESLHEFAIELCDEKGMQKLREKHPERIYKDGPEVAHNNVETREYFLFLLTPKQRMEFSEWKKLAGILCCRKTIVSKVTGEVSEETRYYMTSLTDAEEAAMSCRWHWNVEVNHWYLDVVMREDMMQVRNRNCAHNMSILNKTCVAIYRYYRLATGSDRSINRIRKQFGRDIMTSMQEVLTTLDEKSLLDAIRITPK